MKFSRNVFGNFSVDFPRSSSKFHYEFLKRINIQPVIIVTSACHAKHFLPISKYHHTLFSQFAFAFISAYPKLHNRSPITPHRAIKSILLHHIAHQKSVRSGKQTFQIYFTDFRCNFTVVFRMIDHISLKPRTSPPRPHRSAEISEIGNNGKMQAEICGVTNEHQR